MNRTRPTAEESAAKASAETFRKALRDSLPHLFALNLGDWSDDGHGKTHTTTFGCNKPFKEVVAAYRLAQKRLPKETHPRSIFSKYEESGIEEDNYFAIFDAGYDLLAGFNDAEEREYRLNELEETWEDILKYPQIDPPELGYYVLWFCQQGDPSLVFSEENVPKFFGYEGISEGVGYGLFR